MYGERQQGQESRGRGRRMRGEWAGGPLGLSSKVCLSA